MATQTNKFANDGSFLEQFLKLQEEKKKNEEAKEEPKESATISPPKKPLIGRIGSLKKKTGPSSSKPISQQKVHKVFRDDSDSDPEENEGNKTSNIKQCSQSSKAEDDISKAISEAVERAKRVAKLSNEQDSSRSQGSGNVGPRKRKSRWSDQPPASKAAVDSASASSSGSNYLTPEQQRQLIEQQEMDKLVASIRSAAQKRGKDKGGQYEYDSDEDTEGGTWEHKKRQQEMHKTKDKAVELTEQAKGKHFIGDFLPPEELEKFLEKVQALKEGRDPDFSDYAKYKLQEDNVGYQLLQKAGWTEGTGLGPKEDGRKVPVNKGKQSLDNSGVGTEGVGEVKKEDNEFELYRKRMMLAYRFRPNPLNNPRRPYY